MSAKYFAATLVMSAAIALAGCDYLPFGYTPIKEITAAPGQFEGREVKLKGRAKGTVQLFGMKAVLLQDDTGDITVVTDGQLPAENAEVALKGTVGSAAIIGGSAIGLKVAETRRLR
jgi:hypothetical protein